MSVVYSAGQMAAFDKIGGWYDGFEQEFVLAGYAGTGKSTLADGLNQMSGGGAKFCAFTGKAANVLREKGNDASTIHRALYKPIKSEEIEEIEDAIREAKDRGQFDKISRLNEQLAAARKRQKGPGFALNPESVLRNAFVIVDEYSMLPQQLIDDLRKTARKILYLGDPEQLPPVNGTCGLKPDVFLEEIHRQALDSPIIRYATMVREGKALPYIDEPGFLYQPRSKVPAEAYTMAEQIIVGRNATRTSWNNRFRQRRGIKPGALPEAGEKLICLKNSQDVDLFNGLICQAIASHADDDDSYILEAEDSEFEWEGLNVWLGDIDGRDEQFDFRLHRGLQRFDFAYAITCHKSQGSEFDNVLIYDEPVGRNAHECRRWRYTALTRAKTSVTLVDPA